MTSKKIFFKAIIISALTILVLAQSVVAADVSFAPTANYGVGDGPYHTVSGDLNGDGKLDLVTSNNTDNNISVLLNNGDGTFQIAVNYNVGSAPLGLAVADFNNDSKQDVVVVNSSDSDVSLLLGNGDGTLQSAVSVGSLTGPTYVAVADFNNDGKMDMAITSSYKLYIYLGNGNGTFQTPVQYGPSDLGAFHLITGDFNNDGKIDIATVRVGVSFSVFMGNGNGTFQDPIADTSVSDSVEYLTSGDLNNDGKLDLVTANFNDNNISAFLGNGDGTFQDRANYSTGGGYPQGVIASDFNGDGKQDIASANTDDGNVSILLGNGAGTFATPINFTAGSLLNWVMTGDFNNDGKIDLATANWGDNNVSILLNNTEASAPTALHGLEALKTNLYDGSNNSISAPNTAVAKTSVEFTPTTPIRSGYGIKINFPSDMNIASVVNGDVSISQAHTSTDLEKGTAAVSGQNLNIPVDTESDTPDGHISINITNSHITTPTIDGMYYVNVTTYDLGSDGDFGGSGADEDTLKDSGTAAIIIGNYQVNITGTIDPTLSLTLSTSTCDLGTLSVNNLKTCSYGATTSTNGSSGYTAYVKADGGFRNSSSSITNVGDGAVTPGSEEYGISTTKNSQTIGYLAGTHDQTYCTSLDSQGVTAMAVASALTTSDQSFASASGPISYDSIYLCHAVGITGTTPAGSYSQLVTITVIGNF
jgi:hypothetical protein